MKVERKLSDFSAEKGNRMKIWKQKRKSVERKRKRNFFGGSGSGNGNGTTISGGIDAETEVSVSD
jgi:hypothetical protein